MSVGNSLRIPRHVRAKNEEELEEAILELQIIMGKEFRWLTVYPVKGGVVGWYYDFKQPEIVKVPNG